MNSKPRRGTRQTHIIVDDLDDMDKPTMPMIETLSCGDGCDHSDEEHQAFDAGFAAGQRGDDERTNPYSALDSNNEAELRFDWAVGYSAGSMNR